MLAEAQNSNAEALNALAERTKRQGKVTMSDMAAGRADPKTVEAQKLQQNFESMQKVIRELKDDSISNRVSQ